METKKLRKLNACSDAIQYVKSQKTIISAWQNCERGDWMLWLASMLKVDLQLLTLTKGKCAETFIHLMKDQRSKDAVRAAIAFGEGTITRQELDAADADAAADARQNSLKKSAGICREYLTEEVISKYKKLR